MIIIRTGTLSSGSAIVTVLSKTLDLRVGMQVYGDGIPVNAKILTVDTATQITLDKNAVATGAKSLQFTFILPGVFFERNCILKDAKDIIDERGGQVEFLVTGDSDVTRDSYGSIKKKTRTSTLKFFSYPIVFTPSRRQIELAGLREETQLLLYTATKDWIDNSFDISDIDDERWDALLNGKKYEIKEKGFSSQISDTFLYITFSLFKL